MKGSWFELKGTYTDATGIALEVWGKVGRSRSFQLTRNDVSYLLESIDGHVTAAVQPADVVAFPLYGTRIEVNGGQWAEFVDALGSVAGEGGWQPQFIA